MMCSHVPFSPKAYNSEIMDLPTALEALRTPDAEAERMAVHLPDESPLNPLAEDYLRIREAARVVASALELRPYKTVPILSLAVVEGTPGLCLYKKNKRGGCKAIGWISGDLIAALVTKGVGG